VVVELVGPVFRAGLVPRSLLWPSPGCGLAAAGLALGLAMLPEVELEPIEPEEPALPEEVADGEELELPMLPEDLPMPPDWQAASATTQMTGSAHFIMIFAPRIEL
jgi:hypothetical protein